MTLLAMATPGHDRAPGGTDLPQVIEHLGTTVLDLVCGDPDRAAAVTEIVYFDPFDQRSLPDGAIVLGAGARSTARVRALITAAAGSHASAVILPDAFVRANPETIHVARRAGVLVLALSPGTTWQQLSSLLDSALHDSPVPPPSPPVAGEALFRIANAICTLIDAPVTIEDANANVLAFSDRQEEADFIRIDCVLGRRTIEPYLRADEARGAMRAIRRSAIPVYLDAVELDDERPTKPRLAMAVRAGDEFLGTIWAVVTGPPSAEQEHLLLEASRSVALHLLRAHVGASREHQRASELVATVLGEGPSAAVALTRLGLTDAPNIVMAASLDAPEAVRLGTASSTLARRVHERERLESALRVHLTSSIPGTVVATVNDQVYAVVPARRPHDAALNLEQTCRAFVAQNRSGGEVLVGIGRIGTTPAELRLSRADAVRAIRVLEHTRDDRRVAHAGSVETEALLLDAREIAATHGRGPSDAFARLLDYDRARNASMVETLRAWLDAHGDVTVASAATHVHQNTFRYRLRRISEIGAFSLEDAATRFSLDLQLRLFLPRATAAPATHGEVQRSPAPTASRSAAPGAAPAVVSIRRKMTSRAPKAEYATTPRS